MLWRDEKHPSYHGPKIKVCLGCRKMCSRSAWGSWCYSCNVKRMRNINKGMAQIARSIGDEAQAYELERE